MMLFMPNHLLYYTFFLKITLGYSQYNNTHDLAIKLYKFVHHQYSWHIVLRQSYHLLETYELPGALPLIYVH